jgi:hypothetical protein
MFADGVLAAAGAHIYTRVGSSPTRAVWRGARVRVGAGKYCVHGRGARTNGRLGTGAFFSRGHAGIDPDRGFVRCLASTVSKQQRVNSPIVSLLLPTVSNSIKASDSCLLIDRLRLGNQSSTVGFLPPRDSLTCRPPVPYSRVLNHPRKKKWSSK